MCLEKVAVTEHPTKIFAQQVSKGHQLYILLSFDLVRALKIHHVKGGGGGGLEALPMIQRVKV